MEDLWELFELGGAIMWPILASSILALALFIERLLSLRRRHLMSDALDRGLSAHLQAGDLKAADALVRADPTPFGRVAAAALKHRKQGRAAVKEAMTESGDIALARLERFLPTMATIAAVAPLLGLLGTITGMIDVFGEVERAKQADIGMLAGGIWEALITTGFGLIVAIPVLIAHRYLESRVERFAVDLEERALVLIDELLPMTDAEARPVSGANPTGA
jgi:biopolymer transport protein ExbB